jgi:protein-disulfide isomerase-like protein with CxxC motif
VIKATLFSDPACPWAYSANPALRVLEWRYGDQLDWRLVTIGLREDNAGLLASFNPERSVARYAVFHRLYGMPFSLLPKERPAGTGRGCRAIVAARLLEPGSEWRALRALALGNFTTPLLLDDADLIRDTLRGVPDLDADEVAARIDSPEVVEAYEHDKTEARSAAGTPAEAQEKTSTSDGPVRYTAPSVIFEQNGTRLVAGGWQHVLAYDVLLANLEPALERRPAPESPAELLEHFPDGLVTAEVAALIARSPDYVPDTDAAEQWLGQGVESGEVVRTTCGNDAIWRRSRAADARAA